MHPIRSSHLRRWLQSSALAVGWGRSDSRGHRTGAARSPRAKLDDDVPPGHSRLTLPKPSRCQEQLMNPPCAAGVPLFRFALFWEDPLMLNGKPPPRRKRNPCVVARKDRGRVRRPCSKLIGWNYTPHQAGSSRELGIEVRKPGRARTLRGILREEKLAGHGVASLVDTHD